MTGEIPPPLLGIFPKFNCFFNPFLNYLLDICFNYWSENNSFKKTIKCCWECQKFTLLVFYASYHELLAIVILKLKARGQLIWENYKIGCLVTFINSRDSFYNRDTPNLVGLFFTLWFKGQGLRISVQWHAWLLLTFKGTILG